MWGLLLQLLCIRTFLKEFWSWKLICQSFEKLLKRVWNKEWQINLAQLDRKSDLRNANYNFLAYFFRTTFCLTSSLNNVCECNQCIEDDFYRLHWQLSDKLRPKVRVFYLTVCYQLRNSTLWWFCVWLFLCLIGVANLNSKIHLEGTSQNI